MFSYLREESYLGRAWQLLIIYLNMKFLQPSAQLIYHLIHITGDQLVFKYRFVFKNLLNALL